MKEEELLYGVFRAVFCDMTGFFVTSKSVALLIYDGRKIFTYPGVHLSNTPDPWKQITREELVEW